MDQMIVYCILLHAVFPERYYAYCISITYAVMRWLANCLSVCSYNPSNQLNVFSNFLPTVAPPF